MNLSNMKHFAIEKSHCQFDSRREEFFQEFLSDLADLVRRLPWFFSPSTICDFVAQQRVVEQRFSENS